MGDITSSDVASTWEMTADQMQRALDDLRKHHNHDGVNKGVAMDHDDFLDGVIPDTFHDHDNLRTHLMGTGTSFIDSPGGSAGVHDLGSNYHIVGAGQAKRISDVAKGATDRWNEGEGVQRGRAPYTEAYPAYPHVMFCALSDEPMLVGTHQLLTTSCAWKICAGIPTSSKRDNKTAIDVLQVAFGVAE